LACSLRFCASPRDITEFRTSSAQSHSRSEASPLPDEVLQIVAEGEKEDGLAA